MTLNANEQSALDAITGAMAASHFTGQAVVINLGQALLLDEIDEAVYTASVLRACTAAGIDPADLRVTLIVALGGHRYAIQTESGEPVLVDDPDLEADILWVTNPAA